MGESHPYGIDTLNATMRHVAEVARARPWLGSSVIVLGGLVGCLLLGALSYEHVGAFRDARVLARIGRSIDIGGRSLNIHCVGNGGPSVVLIGGRTSPGYTWTQVQRGVAEFTEACWYDRAGLGWSDPGPDPSWGDSAARDLHSLLRNSGHSPPFVFVGASFGGYITRIYNDRYPSEVAGMVFVDAAHEDAGTLEGIPHRERPPIPRAAIRGLSVVLGRLGMMRYLRRDQGQPAMGWTEEEWDRLARLRRQRNRLLADAQEGPESATAELVRSTAGFRDMPVVVLAQGRRPPDSTSVEASVQSGWIGLQRELAQRSTRGRLAVVANSGHGIALEAPDTVIAAVHDVVTQVRRR
jgi:pimeloyl-ACP methyl ester carboxylesterase